MEEEGLPQRFDRSVWGQKLSGTYGAQLIGALKFLGLIDDDHRPTENLEVLVFNRAQRKPILRDLLINRYPFRIDFRRATPAQLEGEFKALGLQGDTLRKAISFFVQAARYSEIPLSAYVAKGAKRTRGRPRKASLTANPVPVSDMLSASSPVLSALMAELSSKGSRWTTAERHRWFSAFEAAVNMIYPVVDPTDTQG